MRIQYAIILLLLIMSCKADIKTNTSKVEYSRWVGDIEFDASKDSESFKLCKDDSKVYQYFNDGNGLEYEGEKRAIIEIFESQYKSKRNAQTGLIRIRFIVNCNGQTGRFRVLGMDRKYREKEFHSSITSELLRIVKSLNKWKPKSVNGELVDYYQYLIFKIENGEILEILP